MTDFISRSASILGSERLAAITSAHVAVFGVGGVGSFAVEAMARAGVSNFLLVDADVVEASNLNRQLVALNSTIGMAKAEVMAGRIRDINPDADVKTRTEFYSVDNAESFDLSNFSVVIDAIDSVKAKAELLWRANSAGVPAVSAMGAANRMDPSLFNVMDISKTSGDGLARARRAELRSRGLDLHFPCVISSETPAKYSPPSSLVTVTATAGLLLAHTALRVICGER